MVGRHALLYPFFLECSSLTRDAFWENVFERMAYGETPAGARLSNGYLYCSSKDKQFCYKVQEKDAQTLTSDIIRIFSEKLRIVSTDERLQRRRRFRCARDKIKKARGDWSTIRKKSYKRMLIEQYVSRVRVAKGLSVSEMKKLYHSILTGLMFKTISSSDIVFQDGDIVEVKNISSILPRSTSHTFRDATSSHAEEHLALAPKWERYLSDLASQHYEPSMDD